MRQDWDVTEPSSNSNRRRRRRRAEAAGQRDGRDAPRPGPEAAPGATPPADDSPAEPKPPRRPRPQRGDPNEHGLRDLVGAGRSQLGVSGALRGRDVNRPTEQDVAEAEESLVIVRRHWQPTERLEDGKR